MPVKKLSKEDGAQFADKLKFLLGCKGVHPYAKVPFGQCHHYYTIEVDAKVVLATPATSPLPKILVDEIIDGLEFLAKIGEPTVRLIDGMFLTRSAVSDTYELELMTYHAPPLCPGEWSNANKKTKWTGGPAQNKTMYENLTGLLTGLPLSTMWDHPTKSKTAEKPVSAQKCAECGEVSLNDWVVIKGESFCPKCGVKRLNHSLDKEEVQNSKSPFNRKVNLD